MADGDSDSDVKIEVGAEADLSVAKSQILKDFETVERKLKDIGTEEAKTLAKKFSQAAKGLRASAFDAKELEDFAVHLSKAAASAKISNDNISSLSSQIKNIEGRSRDFADWMDKAGSDIGLASKAMGGVSDFIDAIVPKAKEFTSQIEAWAKSLPGVADAIQKIGDSLAPGVGTAVQLGMKVVGAGIAVNNEAEEARRNEVERLAKLTMDEAARKRDVALAELERERGNAESRRQVEAAKREAARIEGEYTTELFVQQSLAGRKFRDSEDTSRLDRYATREKEDNALEVENSNLKERIESEKEYQKLQDDKVNTLNSYLDGLNKEIDRVEELKDKYEDERSAIVKAAEEAAKAQGKEGDQAFIQELVTKKAGAKIRKFGQDIAQALGMTGGLSADDAASLFVNFQDVLISREREKEDILRQVEQLKREKELSTGRQSELFSRQEAIDKQRNLRAETRKNEDNEFVLQRNQRIAEKQFETMGNQNRLTAMGLGGGNAAGNEIAKNTKEMLSELKEIRREWARRPLADGKSMNGQHLAPAARLGDGMMGWGQ